MENQSELKWHQKTSSVILLLVFFFPLGLYFMWKNGFWSSKIRLGVTGLFILLLAGNINKEKTSSKYFENANNYEEAIQVVDFKINEFSETYNDLCGRPHNDKLKERFGYLGTDVNALFGCGAKCDNLSTEIQIKVTEYAIKKLKENNNLLELTKGNIPCW